MGIPSYWEKLWKRSTHGGMAALMVILLFIATAFGVTVPDVPSFSFDGVSVTNMPVATCSPPFNGLNVVDNVDPDDVTITQETHAVPTVEVLSDAWGSSWGDPSMQPEAVYVNGDLIVMVGYNDVQDKLVFKPYCAAGDGRNTIDMVIKVDMSTL